MRNEFHKMLGRWYTAMWFIAIDAWTDAKTLEIEAKPFI